MGKRFLIVLGLFIAAASQVGAQTVYSNLEFIENKGQWDKEVILKGELNNGAFFLQKKGFTVLLHNAAELQRLRQNHMVDSVATNDAKTTLADRNKLSARTNVLHSHNYSVTFVGANDNAEIVPDKPLPTYNNYFIGRDRSKWASECKIYQGVTYKNVYPNIDIRYYSNNGQLKYDIIVHPGGNVKQIALKYDGPEKVSVRNNQLAIKTSVGDVKELEPYAYQAGQTSREEVKCKYVFGKDNILRFDVKDYNKLTTLVIDPTLVFSSFTGSGSSNWGFTATPGPDGSFFAGGIVFGAGFQASPGAFQTTFQKGTFDVLIMKFSSNGTRKLYGTYLGGNDDETPHSLICDPQGNLVVLGRTYSLDFPYRDTAGTGGGADMFVAKLNSTGTGLIGCMRIGGSADDCVNVEDQFRTKSERAKSLIKNYGDDSRSEVILDGANNIYVAASTKSSNFPLRGAPFQPKLGGGQDGVVLKINPTCNTLLFSSYLGGTGDDAAFVLKLNPANGDIFVAGATTGNFPGNKTGVIQSTYQGGDADAYITIISNDGSVQKKTCYFGTSGFDAIYGIEFDKKGFPYIMGQTTGAWPVMNANFVNAGAKQFISKLQPDLSAYVYSTTFGTATKNPNISPVAFLVDRCENVYVSGWGGWLWTARADPYGLSGTLGMPTTPDALQPTTDGHDFYFIVVQKNASALLYGTFFGQIDGPNSIAEHVDGGTSRYDRYGIIYQAICANCGGGSLKPFPTTPAAWARQNGALAERGCNLAAVKIAFNFAGVSADLRSIINGRYDSSGCIPLEVTLMDTLRIAKNYIWNFGDGSPDSATTVNKVQHTYNAVGNYRVRLIAIDSNSCNVADTVYLTIRARTDKADVDFNAMKLPPCESLTYRFENISTAPPGKPFSDTSFVWDFGDGSPRVVAGTNPQTHPYISSGSYNVRLVLVDTNYCNFPDSAQKTLRVSPLVKAQFETPSIGCAPYEATFNNTTLAGQQFLWDFGDGTTSTDVNPVHMYNDTGTYVIKLVAVDSSTCNKIDSTSMTVNVHSRPTAEFTHQPIPPEYNRPTVFFNGSGNGATHFVWRFGDDDSTAKSTMDTVIHQYRATGTYEACLVAFNQFGCTDTACHPVDVLINPLLDVPNAFTPGRFGQNSILKVQGFGIQSLIFRIYNRWGQVVFETNDQNVGWDGTFKGNPQPMDVYTYTLEATYFDGKKTTKAGDITLIR